jgi:tRNA-specific 2-thiouridylase
MSGGVDSSLTAALLVRAGYDVTGIYMKNWSQDLPGMVCPWRDDYEDAKRVAVGLGIAFKVYDFEVEYRQRVVAYLLDGYRQGLTPNPDIMCNQEVKFKLFLQAAQADGADMIATGHYARVRHSGTATDAKGRYAHIPASASLQTAADANKDQTYFLYRVSAPALCRTLMPIGDFNSKAQVRAEAARLGIATAHKKDSQGICFVGKVGIKDFLLHELGSQPHGAIIDQNGICIGEHDGAIFYTIGQRQGLGVGGGLPYYVTGKDMQKNEVYVTSNLQDRRLWRTRLTLTALHWINDAPKPATTYQLRTRHRSELVPATITLAAAEDDTSSTALVNLAEPVRALTPGQSAVVYDGSTVIGGGIVI